MNNSKNYNIKNLESLPKKPCISIGTKRIVILDKTITQQLGIDGNDDMIYFTQELTINNEIILRKIST
jgi:hypothetical protein